MKFPLGQGAHDPDDVTRMIYTLMTDSFTMGKQVSKFETMFAEYVNVKHAVMVNSGSSANLIAFSVLANHKCKNRLVTGDEVLVPALCWSTSIFPIIQCNLVPVFVDVDMSTLNVDLCDLEKKITDRTRAIMVVHILGNCTNMRKLMKIAKRHGMIIVEDSCESLGSKYNNQYLGTFGAIGTYSFYYSHHITTIEGGMAVCNDDEHYELLKCLRAHGWTRSLKNKDEIHRSFPDLDPRFTFVNLGYNMRPMEIQASMGINQLGRLGIKNSNRKTNYEKIRHRIESRNSFLSFPKKSRNADVAWFGIPMFLDSKLSLSDYLSYLTRNGIENRPIVTGNVTRQPVIRDLYPSLDPCQFKGAEECHLRGFFIGLSCNPMGNVMIDDLVDTLLGYKGGRA